MEGEVREEDKKRSHHSKVRCRIPGCGMIAGDIKRHLKVHVGKQIEEEDVPRAAAIMKAGKATRGPRQVRGKKEVELRGDYENGAR